VRYLEALENGDWKQLPGSIFARSFARQYARQVGLAESEIDAELHTIFPQEECLPAPNSVAVAGIQLKPLADWGRAPGWDRMAKPVLSLAAALVMCSGLYVAWNKLVLRMDSEPAAIVDPMQGLPPTKAPVSAAQQIAGTPPLSEPPATAPESDEASEPVPASQPGVENASLAHDSTPPANAAVVELNASDAGSGMSVRIVASRETWVSVSANGKSLFRGILRPNDVRQVNGVQRARMVIGNAGGVEVQTDGRSIGPIGPEGKVRVVVLTPDGPQIMRSTSTAIPSQTD